MNISNWYDVYPKGTKQGDAEEKLFKSLARNKKWKWRSVSALAKESGISEEEVEKILDKYYKLNMVLQHPHSDIRWAYWTNVPDLINKPIESILSHDHNLRSKGIQDFITINVENKDNFEDEYSSVIF